MTTMYDDDLKKTIGTNLVKRNGVWVEGREELYQKFPEKTWEESMYPRGTSEFRRICNECGYVWLEDDDANCECYYCGSTNLKWFQGKQKDKHHEQEDKVRGVQKE